MINIGRENCADPHYRYQRNYSEIRYSGKGKNSKTTIVNLETISKQLYTIPEYIAKYFAHTFATICKKDKKRDEWYLKGKYTQDNIENILEDFIDRYILCTKCRKPETSIKCKKGVIKTRCFVCGTPHKINDQIIIKCVAKHPQDDSKMYRAYVRRNASNNTKKEDISTEFEFIGELPEDDEVEWGEDVSEAAVKARAETLSSAARKLLNSNEYEYEYETDYDYDSNIDIDAI